MPVRREIPPPVPAARLAAELPLEAGPTLVLVALSRELRDLAGPGRLGLWRFGQALELALSPLPGKDAAAVVLHESVQQLDRGDLEAVNARLAAILEPIVPGVEAALDAGRVPDDDRGFTFTNALRMHVMHGQMVNAVIDMDAAS